MHPLKIIMKSKGDNNVTTVASSCQVPSKCSIMVVSIIIVIVILTRCRHVGIVFSASFFSIGELGHLSHEGHCSLWYSVVLGFRAFGACSPSIRPNSSINASFTGNRMLWNIPLLFFLSFSSFLLLYNQLLPNLVG